MSIRLVVVEGPEAGRAFDFDTHETFMVGRGPEAHLRLSPEDRYCSRLHFMIEVNPPFCRLWDMESNNGTFLNGQRIQGHADLKDGDRIKAGRTVLQVSIPPQTGAETTIDAEQEPSRGLAVAGEPGLLQLPEYRIENELGRGGMGVVYRAALLSDGTPVAIKLLRPAICADDKSLRRFLREARVLRRLKHRRITAYRSMGLVGEHLYFVMEFVDGRDLAVVLKARGALEPATAVTITCQILEGLEYAHGRGYVHRDIKPANIMLGRTARGKRAVKITDFGLARIYQASRLSGLTLQGEMGGTLKYAAPEQLLNFREALPASDQYSTAVTLYEMLTGELPLPVSDRAAELYRCILNDPPTPLATKWPAAPPRLAAVVDRALAKVPGERFPDVRAFRESLLAALPSPA